MVMLLRHISGDGRSATHHEEGRLLALRITGTAHREEGCLLALRITGTAGRVAPVMVMLLRHISGDGRSATHHEEGCLLDGRSANHPEVGCLLALRITGTERRPYICPVLMLLRFRLWFSRGFHWSAVACPR